MPTDQIIDTQDVLVELSVISFGGNGKTKDQIDELLNTADKIGLFYVRTQNGTCIEGKWNEISPLIYECYGRVKKQSLDSFLQISIR